LSTARRRRFVLLVCLSLHVRYICIVNHEEDQVVKEERGDIDRMDVQEGDYQEAMGGWTEVDMNAPREFQPKV
jgi:hypothetical protein